jgi:hypothetical protein
LLQGESIRCNSFVYHGEKRAKGKRHPDDADARPANYSVAELLPTAKTLPVETLRLFPGDAVTDCDYEAYLIPDPGTPDGFRGCGVSARPKPGEPIAAAQYFRLRGGAFRPAEEGV